MREFLEKNWTANLTQDEAVRMAVKGLLEVVDSGSKNMEVAVMRHGQQLVVRHCVILPLVPALSYLLICRRLVYYC